MVGALALTMLGACSSDPAPPSANPLLECGGKRSSTISADLVGPGLATADLALDDALSSYSARHGGDAVDIDELTRGLRIGGRLVVIAVVRSDPAGGFLNDTTYVCDPYAPHESGSPATAPATVAPTT